MTTGKGMGRNYAPLPISTEDKYGKMSTLQSAWTNCVKCPLSNSRTNIVFGQGNIDAKLMIIGEAPGEQEDLLGAPFVGHASERFDAILDAVNIKRRDIWITNTCICRPKSNKPGKENRAPTAVELKSCFPRLAEEINIVKPEILVLAGNTPLYLATHRRGITKMRGWQQAKWNGDGFTISQIYATLHPASLLYGSHEQRKQKARWMYNDWLKIARRLGG